MTHFINDLYWIFIIVASPLAVYVCWKVCHEMGELFTNEVRPVALRTVHVSERTPLRAGPSVTEKSNEEPKERDV
jgi:hypothetical protein